MQLKLQNNAGLVHLPLYGFLREEQWRVCTSMNLFVHIMGFFLSAEIYSTGVERKCQAYAWNYTCDLVPVQIPSYLPVHELEAELLIHAYHKFG